ncbi:MAG: hypothetical protein Q4G28_00760 [Neisseria sp.]|nr:hypothetical protein [Neisseria sp.]
MRLVEYRIGQGVNGVLFGLSEAEIAAQIGGPAQRDVIAALDWIPEEMRDSFAGMVVTEHRGVYGSYVFQLTYLQERLEEIKILPEAGPVFCNDIDLFGPRHIVLAELFERYGLPLTDGRSLYFVPLGLMYDIQERDYPVVCFTTGKMQLPNTDGFLPIGSDDADYLTEPPGEDE